MIRQKAAKLKHNAVKIAWRSHEPSRLETFSDGVFAFALTLIIVSVEAPKSFDDLMETMRGTLSFAACFAILFQTWNSQNLFFRRFGLKDELTVVLNAILLFVVLIYAYPLKFLSTLIFVRNTYVLNGHAIPMIYSTQVPTLMIIYGVGFIAINLLFFLMYLNVTKYAEELQLTAKELFETTTTTYINLIGCGIGILAILTVVILPANLQGASGFTYFLIPFAFSAWHSYRGKKARKIFGED